MCTNRILKLGHLHRLIDRKPKDVNIIDLLSGINNIKFDSQYVGRYGLK